jgi:hypothetical protein
MLQLSENLYPVDEVIGTFLQCIVTRADVEETFFWLWELIYTFPDVYDGLVCIYRLFYSTNNGNVGRYITRKVREYMDSKDLRLLADITLNLRNIEPNYFSYLVNYYGTVNTFPTTIYKTKSWMNKYPQNMHNLFGSIVAKDHKNIGYYLAKSLHMNGYEKTNTVIRDFGIDNGIDVSDGIDEDLGSQSLLDMSSMVSRLVSAGDMSPRAHFLRSDKSLVERMEYHFTKKSEKYYLKLSERRMYATHSYLPPGNYSRFSVKNLKDACWYCWEYYTYESVAWNKRFRAYKGVQNHEKVEISWVDDDHLEAFYDDDNAMDFDEQPMVVQMMSLHDIYICQTVEEWTTKLHEIRLTKNLGDLKI